MNIIIRQTMSTDVNIIPSSTLLMKELMEGLVLILQLSETVSGTKHMCAPSYSLLSTTSCSRHCQLASDGTSQEGIAI